ncbi:hypothetical protein FDECE_8874 [Fusarium decemcellulare]|nr:hypothetical protein FDECE_8874 [Fusarium decemcellulare]
MLPIDDNSERLIEDLESLSMAEQVEDQAHAADASYTQIKGLDEVCEGNTASIETTTQTGNKQINSITTLPAVQIIKSLAPPAN